LALIHIGLNFPGLKERLDNNLAFIESTLAGTGSDILNLGLIDNPGKAVEAGHTFRRADVDIIFLYVGTYALSATVLPVVQRAKVPVIILNLSPAAAIDYETFNKTGDRNTMTGEWLTYCSACPVPEIANVFKRAGIRFFEVTGMISGDKNSMIEMDEWVNAARVAHTLSHNTLGAMGNYYPGMMDIYTDLTLQAVTFGGHIEILEVDELSALTKTVTDNEIECRLEEFREVFDLRFDDNCIELEKSARTSVALDAMVKKYGLGSLAYYYKGSAGSENQETIASIILGTSLLTARGIPVAGEYEIKNAQAMKIMDSFGAGGSFTEYYAMDYTDDVVLMGHDGPGHIGIADSKTRVRKLDQYHGKASSGLSVEMSVRTGPVTCLSVIEIQGKIKLLVAEGESVPGPILEIGNTNSRYRFAPGARRFVNLWNAEGPAHHCAIGIGHIASKIKKLGDLLGLETIRIC